ncbi:WAP four-disulfide core domain protein 2 [Pongo pygmaeus]|uniref:WAP four-disulfide core domain protein 2 n=1 Tax=Pongo abelii TaxID=9601 RepID=A0A2J8XVK7_PONAB|nr:WAP four-disulfide core domain protein 2 [Pongo abelii]XP_054323517.1 WAP four-disulfide core domain protein 2 [Pongo pygmaeus]PNJ86062.1 WFDC2 isoform 4 [Pongo abelii]
MPACRLGPLAAALLLCLLLFGFTLVPGTEAEKTGVCPELQADQNCTQECVSDSECADNLKCCSAGCATFCSLPNDKEGSCPQVNINFPQLGLCQDQCQVDSQCPGQMKCCRNGCGNVSCVTPNF